MKVPVRIIAPVLFVPGITVAYTSAKVVVCRLIPISMAKIVVLRQQGANKVKVKVKIKERASHKRTTITMLKAQGKVDGEILKDQVGDLGAPIGESIPTIRSRSIV